MKALLISALIFFLSLIRIKSSVLGIDFGSEFIKITVLKPHSSFKMVENIQSKTKTPASLAFKDEERLFGSDALGKKVRFPKQVFVYMHEFLGKKYDSAQVRKFIDDFFVSYETEEDQDRKTFNFKVNFNKENYIFSIEEIFGMLFRYIKFLSDKYSEMNTRDCVVTVPAFYGYRERLAISQAIELSDLKLIGLITENTAAAVQYATDKQFNKTENIIFYNIGSSYAQATLVSYVSKFETKKNKTVEVKRKISVLAESWDKYAGGNRVNYNFIRHLMKLFDSSQSRKNKPSVLKDFRVAERLLPSAVKYKEILSANKFTPVNILGVESGQNLEAKVTREEFELINKDVFERIITPIEKVLKISGLSVEDIEQIELLGGGVRIPKTQEALRSKVNPSLIGQHMNGDDSMALGACFISANYSSMIKAGKKMEFYHGANYGIKININNLEINELTRTSALNKTLTFCGDEEAESDLISNHCVKKFEKNSTLFEVRTLPESMAKVSFKYDNDLQIKVLQFFEEENIEQQNREEILNDSHILNFKVRGVREAVQFFKRENITSLPKIQLKFELDRKGLLNLKAEAINYVSLYFNLITGPSGAQEFIYTPDFVEPYNQTLLEEELKLLNDTGANKTVIDLAKMKREIGKKRSQELIKDLTVEVEYIGFQPMNATGIEESRRKLDALDKFDEMRIKTMDARNNLESEIYKRRNWLEDDSSKNYIKPEEAELSSALLRSINDWYEEEGYSANITVLENKLSVLKNNFSEVDATKEKENNRNFALEVYQKELKKTYEEGKKILSKKPWVEEHYNTTFLKEISTIEAWIAENSLKQSKLKLYDESDFTGEAIDSKTLLLKRILSDLNKIQKPKPPPIDIRKLEPEDIQNLLKNGTLSLEEFLKGDRNNPNPNNSTDSNHKEDKQTNNDL